MSKMKRNLFIAIFTFFVFLGACSNNEDTHTYQYALQASELKEFGEESAKVITDLAGYKSLFKDEADAGKCNIDFKKQDLIVCRGTSNGNITSITEDIKNHEGTWYISIVIEKGIAAVMEPWCVAYVVPKSATATQVKTDIRYN